MRLIKRLALILVAAIICLSLPVLPAKVCFADGENRVFYCGNTSKNCREIDGDAFAVLKLLLIDDICGESAEYSTLDINALLKEVDGEIIFSEKLSDSVNYYCKANLPYSVELYGQTVNLHICVRESGIKVASPIIFGGY